MPVLHFQYPDNSPWAPMIRYVLEVLSRHPLAPPDLVIRHRPTPEPGDIAIVYGGAEPADPSAWFIPACRLIFADEATGLLNLQAQVYTHADRRLYALAQTPSAEPLPFVQDRHFGFDLIETLFFHLSRYEEYHCPAEWKNEHGEMISEYHYLVRHGLQRQPVADHIVWSFYKALGLEPATPSPCYQLSHDLDELEKFRFPWRFPRQVAKFLLLKGNLSAVCRLSRSFFDCQMGWGKDPYDNLDRLLQSGLDGHKTLYLLVNSQARFDPPDVPDTQTLLDIIELARERGYRIGLHPSYDTWKDPDLWRREWDWLSHLTGSAVDCSRQHYLHLSFPETLDILEAMGIAEDASLGYNDLVGFRCGTGFAYPLYHFQEGRPYRFLEQPLVVMDSALLQESRYQPGPMEQIWQEVVEANRHFTRIAFNFHNSRFDDAWLNGLDLWSYLFRVSQDGGKPD